MTCLFCPILQLDRVIQGEPSGYDVIIDRISQDVPFYRAYLKNEAITGTAVINNPFWWSADDKFFNNALALKVGVAVPKTVILPSKQHPNDTNANSATSFCILSCTIGREFLTSFCKSALITSK